MDKDGLPDIGRCWTDGKISATLMNPALNSGRDGLERDSCEETRDILVLAPLRAELETRFKDATKKEDIRTVLKDIFSRITMPERVLIKVTSKKDVLYSPSAKIDFAVLNSTESLWAYTVAVVQVEFEISGSQYIDALGKITDSFSKVLSEQPARDILYGLIISRFDF
ncbi:hypothetical protein HK098_004609 [Nowakowskiella sp. JEL0407]|nr:hypothetical protein HK098_004609 [Nowakowskiella sp. JEL0407]